MLGYQPQEYVGRNFADFIEKPAVAADLLRRLRACENVRGYELRLRSSDGSWRWVRLDASPWLQDGGYLHARCFVLDIGEKKRADEVQIKLAAIVESSDDAIISKDLNGVITSWNAAAERILGYTAEEMIGKPVTTIIPLDLQRDETEILRRIQAGESIEHFETVRVTKSGQRIDVSLTISPVRDPHGTIIGAAKILRDVTRQKKLEAALRSTEHLAAVGRLAATVAHEINNPLEAVTNLIYLARQDTSLPESARVCLVMADEELKRISHIARQTLGFYRDTSTPVWIDVPTAINEMLAIYHRRLGYRQIGLRKEITAGLRVYALPGEFRQIISNLIVNAIDASSPGTTIDVRAGSFAPGDGRSRHPARGGRPGGRDTGVDPPPDFHAVLHDQEGRGHGPGPVDREKHAGGGRGIHPVPEPGLHSRRRGLRDGHDGLPAERVGQGVAEPGSRRLMAAALARLLTAFFRDSG